MIGEIENAILARLKLAGDQDVLGYAFRELVSLPQDSDETLFERAQQFPAAWTVFGGFKSIMAKGDDEQVRGTFHVVLAAQHLANESKARMGAGQGQPGVYQLGQDVIALLQGQTLGLDIKPLRVGEFSSLFPNLKNKRGLAVWALSFTTDWTVEATPPADLHDFTSFHANWDIRPFGGVDGHLGEPGVQLPADATADATTHINPQQEA